MGVKTNTSDTHRCQVRVNRPTGEYEITVQGECVLR